MNRMSRGQVILLQASVAVTALSGCVFAWMKYAMHTDDPFAVANHPLQPWMLAIHVVVAPLLVFAFGWMFQEHVVGKYLRGAPNRFTGVPAALLFAVMTFSAYLLQASTNESMQRAMRVTHWISSGLFVAIYVAHFIRGWAIVRASGRAA